MKKRNSLSTAKLPNDKPLPYSPIAVTFNVTCLASIKGTFIYCYGKIACNEVTWDAEGGIVSLVLSRTEISWM